MEIKTHEQASEALNALVEFYSENNGCIIAAIDDGGNNYITTLVGKQIDIIPALTSGIITDASFRRCVEMALEAADIPEIEKAFWKSIKLNIQN